MENEIAGKIISFLRGSLSNENFSSSPRDSKDLSENGTLSMNTSLTDIDVLVPESCNTFIIGFSYTQYLDQCVNGLPGLKLDYLEEYNYSVLRNHNKTNCAVNLWNKFCNFLKEYLTNTDNQELLVDLKANTSFITGINDECEVEKAALIIFNIYNREKTSTGRKEELQRIFNIRDFKNIHKISNVINELLKSFSPHQLEEFTSRWAEVFTHRIEALEKQFVTKVQNSLIKKHKISSSKLELLPSFKRKNNLKSKIIQRLKFLNEIRLIEKLEDVNTPFEALVIRDEERSIQNNSSSESHREVVKIEIMMPHASKIDENKEQVVKNSNCDYVEEKDVKKTSLYCEVASNFLCHQFSRKDAMQVLLIRMKNLLQKRSNFSKKFRKTKNTESCQNRFSLLNDSESDADESSSRMKFIGKNWIVKLLKSSVDHEVLNSVNYKMIVLFLLDALNSDLADQNVEDQFIDIFGIENISFIRTLLKERRNIKLHNKPSNKRTILPNCRVEVDKLKALTRQKRLMEDKQISLSTISNKKTKLSDLDMKMRILGYSKSKQEEFPHIFDSNLEVKLSSSYINGSKIMLPEQAARKDTRVYEEITIPVKIDVTCPVNIKEELVSIASLDRVGQSAFAGIQTLNRIQSVVFQTAYHSNENLLVCAPTGSGKTNVALLTMVHEIRQNMENGIIKRDHFKIVYIAPMKALAAEMAANFSKRLRDLSVTVRELTGDMQLTKSEIAGTQLLVTTPEKWDLVTRKGEGDTNLSSLVKLLIIDEVHLLHSDRGPVIEALVARTLRQVETSQKMIRIVGLSATLPNYKDVAIFLRVNYYIGLFYFDSRFRPVPLSQCFVGVKARKPAQVAMEMNQVCYEKILLSVKSNVQVMVFVHARNLTVKTAIWLKETSSSRNHLNLFAPDDDKLNAFKRLMDKKMESVKAKPLQDLLPFGFAVHHAGLLRHDRSLVEEYFSKGLIKVLVCTSTLAWGVNLPAHTVIIKGTEIYDSKHGSFVDIGILDVLQIFGRAGRPQYNESGHGIIITTHDKLHHYLALMMNQFPIESRFISYLADNLNAEITLGTITTIDEAIEWLSYTYLFVRMRLNPQEYGINYTDVERDHTLFDKRKELIEHTAKILDKLQMIRYNEEIGKLSPTDLGRTASLFYVRYDTIETFNGLLQNVMNEAETLTMLSQAHEFEQLKIRDEEMDELDCLEQEYCEYTPSGGTENIHGKVNILLQTYLSRGHVRSFSLISDVAYISQNASRIMRALFDIVLRRSNPLLAGRFLQISQMFERQQWYFETPLRQFNNIPFEIIDKIEKKNLDVEKLKEMDSKEIGVLLRHAKLGDFIKKCANEFPMLALNADIQPITRTILRVRLLIKANFVWNDKIHGKNSEPFWVWVEDPETNFMYHSEYFFMTKRQVIKNEVQELSFTLPVYEPLPSQYVIRVPNDRWLGSVTVFAIPLHELVLPELFPIHTELLPLQPLPVTALKCPEFESLYKFTHFNPIQTQIFHCLYYTDNNVLLGAPTGSGKTIVAEIAFFRVFNSNPDAKVVYIAPLKALVKERIRDWKARFQKKLKKGVVELTGDVTPDIQAISSASIIVTTPEKWDSISRSWQTRNYVQKVVLLIIDEIHLLGEDRGPVLEVIVSRTNFISSHTLNPIRVVGLSTAVANAPDLANWLRIKETGLYNFRPSVRPVPLEVHITAFPGKYYCPRMASMNKPAFQAIKQYSPSQPVLIFVSSRRQTRLTAMDLLAHLASENNPKQWLKLKDTKMDKILDTIKDDNLKVVLAFGVGLHHAGLQESDRKTVEELFEHQHIQVLIATSTLAWGVNFPAQLVIVKGTEYFDCKSHRYVDMPITDILQMMGRAGRPQFDKQGIAVIMVYDVKKNFYKRFLYEPFPVESNLLKVLPDHLNAEIVAGTIQTCQSAIDYLTWTYFFRRLLQNPTFYGIKSCGYEDIYRHLTNLITSAVRTLEKSSCVMIDEDGKTLHSTSLGRIASYYYISHETMLHFSCALKSNLTVPEILDVLSKSYEYKEIPVRHNEEILNADLAKCCKIKVDVSTYDSPHTKTNLLLQAHFSRLVLPCSDYQTDLKTVLDNAIRIMQAMIDVCGEFGWLVSTLRAQQFMQMLIQARWITDHPLLSLPNIEAKHLPLFCQNSARGPISLPALCKLAYKKYGELLNLLRTDMAESKVNKIYEILCHLPRVMVDLTLLESVRQKEVQEEHQQIRVQPVNIDPKLPIVVKANKDYVIQVKLTQLNQNKESKVYAPKFSKPKDECWFLTMGTIQPIELLALKRFYFGRRKEVYHNFEFKVPDIVGSTIVAIYLISDSYMGLDQQYNIQLDITK